MFKRLITTACGLAACVPAAVVGQQETVHRNGAWEFSLGGGSLFVDSQLRDFLGSGTSSNRFADTPTPSRAVPLLVGRVGYNFGKLGLSITGEGARGDGLEFYTSTAALTYNFNLNGSTSPFIMGGPLVTRVEGENDRVTHTAWGTFAGAGVRQMISDHIALRLEGNVRFEGFDDEVPMDGNLVFNPTVVLGLSFFTGGRRKSVQVPAPRPEPCPVCEAPRRIVDTVRVYVPFAREPAPIVELRDTLVLEGVNFAFDQSALTPESHTVLDQVARLLLEPQWANVRFEVAGHTSEMGTAAYNRALSERRAEAVRAYLVSRGIENNRMTARGYGETQPLFPNDREGQAWQNRRVELRRIR